MMGVSLMQRMNQEPAAWSARVQSSWDVLERGRVVESSAIFDLFL